MARLSWHLPAVPMAAGHKGSNGKNKSDNIVRCGTLSQFRVGFRRLEDAIEPEVENRVEMRSVVRDL